MPIFSKKKKATSEPTIIAWARPEMQVTFRAELMPGRNREERTYRIKTVRANASNFTILSANIGKVLLNRSTF